MNNLEYLTNVSLFNSLTEDELRLMSGSLQNHTFKNGEKVIKKNEESDALYIIEEGGAKVCLKGPDGKEILIDKLGKGQFFGEIGLLDGKPRTADVICTEPSKMLKLNREDFYNLAYQNPSILQNLLVELCERLRRADNLIQDSNIPPIDRSRLLSVLFYS